MAFTPFEIKLILACFIWGFVEDDFSFCSFCFNKNEKRKWITFRPSTASMTVNPTRLNNVVETSTMTNVILKSSETVINVSRLSPPGVFSDKNANLQDMFVRLLIARHICFKQGGLTCLLLAVNLSPFNMSCFMWKNSYTPSLKALLTPTGVYTREYCVCLSAPR